MRPKTIVYFERIFWGTLLLGALLQIYLSWASGIFGKADTTFISDGSAKHKSGVPGKWWCEKGQLHMSSNNGVTQTMKLSTGGKQLINIADDKVGFSRD